MDKPRFPELSIRDLISKEHYFVPRYQRNYAWTESHIKQLIDDVLDSMREGTKTGKTIPYYIGTLVVFPRSSEKYPVQYEVIDGQQRLTTLTLLGSFLTYPERAKQSEIVHWYNEINLDFESRPLSTKTLQSAHNGVFHDGSNLPGQDHLHTEEIVDAYEIIQRLIPTRCAEYGVGQSEFTNYLLEYVKVCRVDVPKDTDLNHYFEIMNNRGEQLEKHEVLKARLLNKIKDNREGSVVFNEIWEACSTMDRYVQYCFNPSLRVALFGNHWNEFVPLDQPQLFDLFERERVVQNNSSSTPKISQNEISSTGILLSKIISGPQVGSVGGPGKGEEEPERFSPIINFPNLLLHVLSIFREDGGVPLDDKQLLGSFTQLSGDEILDFGYCLLKVRFLFDQYVIKRDANEDDREWSLKELHVTPAGHPSYRNVFSSKNEEKSDNQKHISLLQSMFHVSVPSRTYKYWLQGYLLFLTNESSVSGDNVRAFLFELARAFVYNRFLAETPLEYLEIIFANRGQAQQCAQLAMDKTRYGNVENILLFNFLDYLLWQRALADPSRKPTEKIRNFTFTFRSSVEHYYPQNPINGERLDDEDALHSIGNLCLISHSENSALRNNLPIAKAERYGNSKHIGSMKQYLMMSEAGSWSENPKAAIQDHNDEILAIINRNRP